MKLLFFRGTILGEIALAPYAGEPRPQAPWLNPGEFGSIFIPKGAPGPFASLSIEESLRYDFRARAVKRAAAKIIELEAILNLDQTCCWSDEEHTHNSDQLELFQSGNQEVNAAD
jgi:hypothetical protein